MMKKLFFIVSVIVLTVACGGPIEEVPTTGDIAGIVYDKNVGDPISVAQVQLIPGGVSTVTGTDGSFSFNNIEAGSYTVTVTKKGYNDASNKVTVVAGKKAECHLLMERIPAYVTADKSELDFGDNLTLTTLSFNIVNSSYENLSWHIDYDKSSSSFIAEVSPESGTTQFGKTAVIVVKIDREKLNAGANESTLVVVSDNGDGSSEVKVKAVGQERSKASLNVNSVTDITSSTAIVHGEITHIGTPAYTERGFVYATKENPTIEVCIEKVTASVTEDAQFSYMLKNLALGEKYYVRAFAINSLGVAYSSNQESFITIASLPVVSVSTPDHIDASKKTVTLHGTVDSVGDPAYSEKGFVYCEGRKTPTIDDSYVKVSGTGVGTYDTSISGLKLGSTYCVRSYAKNEGGIAYSEKTVEFTINGTAPVVSIGETTNINLSELSAILHGNLESLGSPIATEKGFVYSSVNKAPTVNDLIATVAGIEIGTYYSSVSQLEMSKTYYVRAYAKNETGIVYSSETTSFSTNPSAPNVAMCSVTGVNLSQKTAVFQGTVDYVGDPIYNEKGFVFSETNKNPTLSDLSVKVVGTGSGTYETKVSDLLLGKTYYVRAYANNASGTVYSLNVINFSTVPTPASVTMNSVINIDREKQTALFQGSVVSVGDPAYSEKGFVYSKTNNLPTVNDDLIKVSGSDVGSFETTATGLALSKYYVRAYVKNEAGTAYSKEVVSFEISGTTPIVSISEANSINLSSMTAVLNGYVNDVGFPVISERGFVYSFNNSSPTINDSKVTASGAAGGSYSVQIGNLLLDKTYHVKAYVKNTDGLYYSRNAVSFSTAATLPILSITTPSDLNTVALTASVFGRIESAGNPVYTEKGFVYGYNNVVPTVENDNVINVNGAQTGTYSTTLTNLVIGKKYYVRAFAKNAKGIAYSEVVSFSFDQSLPVVRTDDPTNLDLEAQVVILHGAILNVGNPPYQERGFVLSTKYKQPTVNDQKIIVSGSGIGEFDYRLTEFSKADKTYVRTYAINNKGVAYGESILLFDPSFVIMEDYILLKDKGIAVQKKDIGVRLYYYEAENLCSHSNVGSINNWRLPTNDELIALYGLQNRVGEFDSNGYYWSSDHSGAMAFFNGTYVSIYVANARCVSSQE